MSITDKYQPVIGLEIHAQMLTKSKAFCRCSTDFSSPANSNVCPICLGHPGVLPVLNEELVNCIIMMGLATNCKIRERSIFARKNYFYPDLSKGYQISQYETPICYNGFIMLSPEKKIGVTRIHMEEDAGKSIHDFSEDDSLVDFNRCGVPLIEIVSEPDIRSVEEATLYLQKIKQILVYLGINDGSMEEGSLRCDANISIMPKGSDEFGRRTEIKNLNSFKNVADAIEAEIKRQAKILDSGGEVVYHTMTYNAKDKTTTPTRTKEEAHDYRYFPEPDLVPVKVSESIISEIRSGLPEFPDTKKSRFISEFGLPEYDADVLIADKNIADYFEDVINSLKEKNTGNFKHVSNWVMTEVMRVLNEEKILIDEFKVPATEIASLVENVNNGTINKNTAKEVFNLIVASDEGKKVEQIIQENNLAQVSDTGEIESIIKKILDENPDELNRLRNGETKLTGFFVGKIMIETKGKANPKIVNDILSKQLSD